MRQRREPPGLQYDTGQSVPTRFAPFGIVTLVSLIIIFIGIVAEIVAEVQHVEQHEHTAVSDSFDLAEERLNAHLDLLRSRLTVSAYREIELIRELFTTADNFAALERLERRVVERLPGAFAVTVSRPDGQLLVPDMDGLVADICIENIRQFAQTGGEYQIRVHPNPRGYHFDVMVPFVDERDGHEGIFFVSFQLDYIARLLRESQLRGHELMLLFEPVEALIEVHPHGGRDALVRSPRLSAEEQARLMLSRHLNGTQWRLVDLPDEGLLQRKSLDLLLRYSGYLLLLLLMIVSVVVAMRRDSLYRRRLEEANSRLEEKVARRTEELKSANERVGAIIENASDAIIAIDSDEAIRLFNPGAERLFGYRAEEVIGKPLAILLPPELRELHSRLVKEFSNEPVQTRNKDERTDIKALRKDGTVFDAEATLCKMEVGGEQYFTAFVRDATERKAREARMLELAMSDALTGLANRRQFEARLGEALAQADRVGCKVGLLLLDLDDFKPINDTHGHQIGDKLLCRIAEVLKETFRESDVVARLGGDEFAVILTALNEVDELDGIARKLLERVAIKHDIDGITLKVGVSIGIAVYAERSDSADELFTRADHALYAAKAQGKHTYHIDDSDSGV
ncbi:MAG: diguanylate cyclase domain-containing protein [Pseudomonadota bacterium]